MAEVQRLLSEPGSEVGSVSLMRKPGDYRGAINPTQIAFP